MRIFLLFTLCLILNGCATAPRPEVQIEIRGEMEAKPEYTITLNL